MEKTYTPDAPEAIGPYSQAISANGFLFASGQVPLVPGAGTLEEGGITAQADRACRNVGAILRANGLTFQDVVKTTCFLADMGDFAAFNEVYAQYFTGKPARSCVAVKELPRQALCEIEIIAALH